MALYINKDKLVERLSSGYIPIDDGKFINVYKAKNLEMDDLTTRRVFACVMLLVNSLDDEGVCFYPRQARAEKLKGVRLEHKMSVSELARRSGVSLRHIHKIESGKCEPFQQTLVKLADALGVKVEMIM